MVQMIKVIIKSLRLAIIITTIMARNLSIKTSLIDKTNVRMFSLILPIIVEILKL